MKTPYFELGNLKLDYEYTMMEYDNIPLLFVCTNQDIKYLCICNSINGGFRWVVVKTSIDILRELVEQKISICEAFKQSKEPYYVVIEKNADEIDYHETDFEKLRADNELPEVTLMLDDEFLDDDVKEQIINLANAKEKYVESYTILYLDEPKEFHTQPMLIGDYSHRDLNIVHEEEVIFSDRDREIIAISPDYGFRKQVENLKKEMRKLEGYDTEITCHNEILNKFAA